MKRYFKLTLVVCVTLACCCPWQSFSQSSNKESINWLSFEQLDDSLEHKSKPVLIYFSTKWCTYCRKMDKRVFTRQGLVSRLNEEYYAVKMDAESTDSITFDGQLFVNPANEKEAPGIHQLASFLGSRNGQFMPPVTLILNKDFEVVDRFYEYVWSEKLLAVL